MNKIKWLLYFIICVALVIIVVENHAFFTTRQQLIINLKYKYYTLPAIANGLYILGAFVIGCLYFYMKSLMIRFQTKRTVKFLNARMKVQLDELASLRKEVEFLHRNKTRTIHVPNQDKEPVKDSIEPEIGKPAEQNT